MKYRFLFIVFLFYCVFFISSAFNIFVLKALSAGTILFILPGFCLTSVITGGKRNPSLSLVIDFFISSFIGIAGLLFFKLTGLTITVNGFMVFLSVVTVSGIFIFRDIVFFDLRPHRLLIFGSLAVLLCLNAYRMPHIIDQDLHFIAPGYGCVYTLKPYTSLSRVPYLFDHSQLPVFMSALSIFIMGDIDLTKHFYLRAKEIENKYPKDMIQSLWHVFPGTDEPTQEKWLFKQKNVKFSARIPHFFMGALCLLIIMEIAKNITGSMFAGIFAAIISLTPGLFARFSSSGWTSSIILMILSVVYVYIFEKDKRVLFFLGFLGGLINQKTIIAVLSVLFTDLPQKKIKNTLLISGGWATGIIFVSVYGYALNWNCFLNAFFLDHGITGLLEGTRNIAGFFASWTRSSLYMNPINFILAGISVICFALRKARTPFWIIPSWFFTGSLIFIISKWPNARNAAIVYPALFICLVSLIWEIKTRSVKRLLIFFVAAVYLFNIFVMRNSFLDPNSFYASNEDGKDPVSVLDEYRKKIRL